MIEEYRFGSITINKKTYTHDVEVRWGPKELVSDSIGQADEVLPWWREQSHIIDIEDIKRATDQNPEIIIIGTGQSGIAQITKEAKEEITTKGIKLIIDVTEQAIKSFNILARKNREEKKQKKIIGLFHLTC